MYKRQAQTLPVLRKIVDRVEVRRGVGIERGLGKERYGIAENVSEIQKALSLIHI